MMILKIKKLYPDAIIPTYGSEFAAGLDLYSHSDSIIESGQTCLVPTGIAIEIPEGFEGQIRPRSGLAYSNGITVLNSPGTIDSDYRGEIKVLLINHDPARNVWFDKGSKIAQLVICPIIRPKLQEVQELTETKRGSGGFGSTGK
jgi:dUTP pyrophosphatase